MRRTWCPHESRARGTSRARCSRAGAPAAPRHWRESVLPPGDRAPPGRAGAALQQAAAGRALPTSRNWELRRACGKSLSERVARLASRPATSCVSAPSSDGTSTSTCSVRRRAPSEPAVVDLLEQATAAALLTAVVAGRYSFAHAVIQYTLYDSLSPTRRQLAHRRVAEALERLYGAGPGPGSPNSPATGWPPRRQATRPPPSGTHNGPARPRSSDLAFEDAIDWFSQALELQARQPPADGHQRAELLIGLGSARATGWGPRPPGNPPRRRSSGHGARRH